MFYTEADEINFDMETKEITYDSRNANTWYEVGLQILHALGWGPECAVADILNNEGAASQREEGSPVSHWQFRNDGLD